MTKDNLTYKFDMKNQLRCNFITFNTEIITTLEQIIWKSCYLT